MKSINKTKNDSISEQASVTKEEMIEFASKYKNIEAFKDFDDETTYWFIMLFILLMYIDYNTQKLWESFAEEVKTKNRFFPESELLKKISDIAEKATCTISKGDILYRARDYTKQDFFKNDMVIALSEIMKDEFSNLEFDATYYSPVVTPRASRSSAPSIPRVTAYPGRAGPHMYLKKFSWCRKLPEK